jgi:hypothetical protein
VRRSEEKLTNLKLLDGKLWMKACLWTLHVFIYLLNYAFVCLHLVVITLNSYLVGLCVLELELMMLWSIVLELQYLVGFLVLSFARVLAILDRGV